MTWIELQKVIEKIFEQTHLHRFKAILEKDVNGWNWILNFHKLTSPTTLIIHTRFIFKLDENKENLRSNEFLYLYDLNCKYKLIKFKDAENLEERINKILEQDLFGKNLMAISELMIAPEQTINNYFYENDIEGYSIYSFDYSPEYVVIPCQKLSLDFKFNVNNKTDVSLDVRKIKDETFKLTFKFLDKNTIVELEDLTNLIGAIAMYIQKNIGK